MNVREVLEPYEMYDLSNESEFLQILEEVLEPYEMYDLSNRKQKHTSIFLVLETNKMYDISNDNYHDRDENLVWKHVKCMTYQTGKREIIIYWRLWRL